MFDIFDFYVFFVAMGLHHMLLKADISIIVYIIIILSEMFVFIIPSPFKENIKLDKKHNVIMKIKTSGSKCWIDSSVCVCKTELHIIY